MVAAASTVEAAAAHSVRTAPTVEALASAESSVTTGEAAVAGMCRPAVDAVIDVVVVVSLMVPPIAKVIPIVKVTIVVKIMVGVTEEKNRREAHVKR